MNEILMKEALSSSFDIRYGDDLDEYPEYEFSDRFEKQMDKLILRQRKPYFELISTKTRRIVCVFLIVFVSLMITTFSVEAAREQVKNFIVNFFSDHVEINFNKDNMINAIGKVDIDSIDEKLPDGFVLVNSIDGETNKLREYRNDEEFIIISIRNAEYMSMSLDIEQFEYESYYDEFGKEYIISAHKLDNQIMIMWIEGSYLYEIVSNLERNDIFKILE